MQNYNQQQQAVILKGIAQQILQMNVPSFAVVMNLFNEFEYQLVSQETITGFEKKIDSLERVQEIHMKSINSLQTALDEARASGYSGELVKTVTEAWMRSSDDKFFESVTGKDFEAKGHTIVHHALKLEESGKLGIHQLIGAITEK